MAVVNPQGEPLGYNRRRTAILNAPFIAVDMGSDDGVFKQNETGRPGFGNVYITYFDGVTQLPANPATFVKAAEIHLSTSSDDGESWGPEALVSDDGTTTTHVFPTVQAGKNGEVYVAWIDRRLDTANNILNDTWATASGDLGVSFGTNKRQSDVSTSWFARADAAPNFGDYNSSELLNFNQFFIIWADGRFLPPGTETVLTRTTRATPDVVAQKAQGLGN